MSEGWKCPVCGRGVAPSEKTCEHGAGHGGVVPTFIPRGPPWPNQWLPSEVPNDVPSRTADWYRWRPPYEITCGSVESVSAGVLWNLGH